MKHKITAYILSILIFGVTFIVTSGCFVYATAIIDFYPHHMPEKLIFAYAALNLLIPTIFAIILSRVTFKRICGKPIESQITIFNKKPVAYTITILYLFTLIAGIPAIQSHNSAWAVETYKDLQSGGDPRVWEAHPKIKSYFSAPILPFVLITYHEYQLSGLYGWGGWDIQLWYILGVKRIARLPLWLS
jgi:hypothetical protein